MEPVKLGVIGCGVIGRLNMAEAMASDLTEVVVVADLRPESREYAQEQGVARIYEGGHLTAVCRCLYKYGGRW